MALQHLRSSTANKRPTPASMADGQIAVNTNSTSPGLFYKDSAGDLVKVGPVHVGTTAPNATPAAGGATGNSVGEQWLDTTGGTYVFKVWDGSAWRSDTATFVDVNGDTMTGALGIIAGDAATPGLFVSGDTNTGIYSPGADQVAISTGGTGRLFVNSTGLTSLGQATSPNNLTLSVGGSDTQSAVGIYKNGTLYGTIGSESAYLGSGSSNNLFIASFGAGNDVKIIAPNNYICNAGGSERMRLDSSGNLGLGTSTFPYATGGRTCFEVNGTSSSLLNLKYSNTPGLTITSSASANTVESNSTLPVVFYTNGSERMRLESGGRLLLGTSSAPTGANSQYARQVIRGNSFDGASTARLGLQFGSTASSLSVGGTVGDIYFTDGSGNDYALIAAARDTSGTSAGRLVFSTTADGAGAPTERMRIDSAGKVLIKTVAAGGWPSGSSLIVEDGGGASYSGITIGNGGSSQTDLTFSAWSGSGSNYWVSRIRQNTSDLTFSTSSATSSDATGTPTERMRITTGGYLKASNTGSYVGSTGAYHELRSDANNVVAEITSSSTGSAATCVEAQLPTVVAGKLFTGYAPSLVYQVLASGNVQNANNSYGSTSDAKLKENIIDAATQWDDIKNLKVRKYNFKEGQTHTQIGLIAQEVELVSPGLVSESPDLDEEGNELGTVTKSVNYSVLYMKAVKALQEAIERIETLEAKVAALEGV